METRPATMRDIARLAGVNQSTVSRVLDSSGAATISTPVRQRVLSIARNLRYHRNPSAVALRTGSTSAVLVVITDITDSYFSSIISGIEAVLVREGFSMILHSLVHAGTRPRLEGLFHSYRLDGALLLGALPGLPDEEILALSHRGIPLVMIGRTIAAGGFSSVTADNRLGGCLSASHLCDLGHRRIAFMRGPRGWPDFPQRLEGFRREISRRAFGGPQIAYYPCRSRRAEAGYEATAELLREREPTALVCLNDATALGSIRAIVDQGLRVPRDISVIGFDDDELAAYHDPPLTTIRQPRLEMGTRGVEELLAAIRGKAPVTTTVLDVSLVVRGSTCPPA